MLAVSCPCCQEMLPVNEGEEDLRCSCPICRCDFETATRRYFTLAEMFRLFAQGEVVEERGRRRRMASAMGDHCLEAADCLDIWTTLEFFSPAPQPSNGS